MRDIYPHGAAFVGVVHIEAEQAGSGKGRCLLEKRDWIRGLIFSYAGPEPELFPDHSDPDR
jgi:hypothetical protein